MAVSSALEALGLPADVEAFDGWLEPTTLAAALASERAEVLMRVGGELAMAEDGFAAVPGDPMFMVVGRDTTLRLRALRGEVTNATALSVRVDAIDEACCDSAKCSARKHVHRVWLELDGGATLLLGESLEPTGIARVGLALGRRLGIAIAGCDPAPTGEPTPGKPLSAQALARWTLRREGSLFVLRDHASLGPREQAAREWLATGVLAVVAAVAWVAAHAAYRHQNYENLAIMAAIGVVLTLAAYAMFHIAAHSARYRARSEALFFAARDRFVIAPWHSRTGAVNEKLEGRYGAALRATDLESIEVIADETGYTLRANSNHGPYDIGTLESEEQARAWRNAMQRLMERVAHQAAFALAALFMLGCTPPIAPPDVTPPPPQTSSRAIAPTATSHARGAAPTDPSPAPIQELVMVEDNVDLALAEAKKSGRAVFVEVWAPWCHTCLSMKNFVLPDPSIAALQSRVVFAAIDSDRPVNEAFMDRYAVMVWPTLYVLDASDGEVIGLWQGAASVKELREFITTSVDARDAKLAPDSAVAAMLEAKRAHAAARWEAASASYQQAIDRGGAGWKRRSEALAGLQFSEYRRGNWSRCAQIGRDHIGEIQGAAVPADFAWVSLRCASELKDDALRKETRRRALVRLRQHTESPPPTASADDKSDALAIYADALRDDGDPEAARHATLAQIAILEAAAAGAPGFAEAATFDYARMNAYLALGQGDKAVAMLTERITQLPDSYEPPARLAQALMALKRHAEAAGPLADAVAKSYGPRKLQYLATQATLHKELGNAAGEKESLQQLLAAYDELSAAQQKHPPTKQRADTARKRLDAL